MSRRLLLAAVLAALVAPAASCGARPSRDIEGFYEGNRVITLTYPSGASGETMFENLEAQITGRRITIIMIDCTFEANWEIGTDMFTDDMDVLCTVPVQGDATDIFGSATVIAPGDGTISFDLSGIATDGTTGESGTFTLAFDGVIVMDN